MHRHLKLPAPGSSHSSAIERLTRAVAESGGALAWLDLVEREYSYLIAMARLRAEKIREQRIEQDNYGEALAALIDEEGSHGAA